MCLRLLTNVIIIIFKMKIITFIVLVAYTDSVVNAMRNRENFNELIPNNDVNIHAKLKKILTEDDINPSELLISDYADYNNPIVEKIVQQNALPINDISSSAESDNNSLENVSSTSRQTSTTKRTTTKRQTTTKKLTTTTSRSTTKARAIGSSEEIYESNIESTSTALSSSTLNFEDFTTENTLPITTVKIFPSNPSSEVECLLGKVSETLKWVNGNGTLQKNYILNDEEMQKLEFLDMSRSEFLNIMDQIKNIGILSLAYNSLMQFPAHLIDNSYFTLQYLSLAGNDFQNLSTPINLPNLQELDLRNCKLRTIHRHILDNLKSLKYLYLSNNNIAILDDNAFNIPSLIYLDLSFNKEKVEAGDLPNPLKMSVNVFEKLTNLQFLDLSHTKIETKAISSLNLLSSTLIGISLCYTELLTTGDNFLSNLTRLKFLDISGNTQLNFTKNMFHTISSTLERLDARDANVEKLEWTHPLTNLRVFNLNDNKIRYLDNNSFSHMLYLKDLNIGKNSLGNWYSRLFTQNQELKTLNLRENTLTMLTDDMMEDLMSVEYLAIGKNKFECSCNLHNFMLILFETTKNANISQLKDKFNFNDKNFDSSTTSHPISIGLRSNLRPEYDIISRTYQKYYDQILTSIQALKKNHHMRRKSKSFLSVSDAKKSKSQRVKDESVFHTILLDYDENNEDYQCMNVTEKQKQSILDLIDLCDDINLTQNDPPYMSINDNVIITLSTSILSVILFILLLFLIYWKWWYIRYFFILCKNSAILAFMNDNDDAKEAIVRRKSTNSLDLFLYDVFVSYSDYNRSWVLDEFIPNIEKRESINVCLHERDFTVGYGILENIISCMDKSRCLLLLISEKFLESQWCQFEMNLAQHRLLETRKEKLIVVLLEDIAVKSQPRTLRYLMRTKTYIKWPKNGSNDEKQLFWRRLKKSIISTKWEHENYGSTI